jgi:hypothetical protein
VAALLRQDFAGQAGEKYSAMMRMKFMFLKQPLSNPHTHKSKIANAFGCGDFLEAFYLRFIHPYRDKVLARPGEFDIPNLSKFMRVVHNRMCIPEFRLFLVRFKFWNALHISHSYLPPHISLPFRPVHIPCGDNSRDAFEFILKHNHNISSGVTLPETIISIRTPSENKRFIEAGLFNFLRRYAMPGNMAYISFIPFKRGDAQGNPPFDNTSIYVYTKDVKRKVLEVTVLRPRAFGEGPLGSGSKLQRSLG